MDTSFCACPPLASGPVRLEQLSAAHAPGLIRGLEADGEIFQTWYTRIPAPGAVPDEIERRLREQAVGRMAPWAIIDTRTDDPVGMTTFMNIDAATPRVEIGSTWLLRAAHRTGINTHAKRLLLARAFEDLGCLAVEFRTHFHNHQSRAAIARLGAKQDGVLRQHMVVNGVPRDTVIFSILDAEWPAVRLGLDFRAAAAERRG